MKRLALTLCLCAALPGTLRADFGSSSIGTTSGDFLQLGAGARAMGMGEAYTAMADDATALYWNPAGLTRLPERYLSISLMNAPYAASSYYDYGAIAQNFGAYTYGAFGFGMQYFTIGAVTQTDQDGTQLGTFNPSDLAVSLGYARMVNGFSFGATAKIISSKIATTAQTEAVDLGILSPAYFRDRLRLALVLDNLGGNLKYDQAGQSLPRTLKAGAAWHFNENWTAAADAGLPSNNSPYLALGAERLWRINYGLTVAGRAGLNTRTLSGLNGLTSASLGAGLVARNIEIDYAFLPMGSLGATHRISLAYKFDTRRIWKEASAVETAVQYSSATSLPPPSRLHCEEYHGVTVCMDAEDRERVKISYEAGDQETPQAQPQQGKQLEPKANPEPPKLKTKNRRPAAPDADQTPEPYTPPPLPPDRTSSPEPPPSL